MWPLLMAVTAALEPKEEEEGEAIKEEGSGS
jgi:hypothetical protein